MRGRLNPQQIAVECSDCGKTTGLETAHGPRCGDCGQFARETDGYCIKHSLNWGRLNGYGHCPKCREEERVRQMEQEMHARRADPNMHPTVDARRR